MSSTDKRSLCRISRILVLVGFISSSIVSPALAGPSGGRVVSGDGSISHNGNTSRIDQTTDRLIIEWDSFDTTAQEQVRFYQPSSDASVLNRVLSGHATMFDGSLFANGNVIIVNGAGIHFGPNARVDVGSLIASTAGISNSNFLNDRLIFDQPGLPHAMVSNEGMITVRDTGLAALVAPGVENSGLIRANLGTVILGAGEAHTIDFSGDGLVAFTITEPTKTAPKRRDGTTAEALVNNSGTVEADGGSIVMTASQASRVLDNAINMSGVAQANSVGMRNGKIVLFGGGKGSKVKVSGRVSARGRTKRSRGGTVHVAAKTIETSQATFELDGEGGGGTLLIGGPYKGGKLPDNSPIGYLKDGDLVSILTGDGVGAAGDGYFPNAEAVFVDQGTLIDVSATGAGGGGRAILWSDGKTGFNGTILARGGADSGNGGFVETSGKLALGVGATANVDALAPNGLVGDWLLDPANVTVQTGGTATLAQVEDTNDTTSDLIIDPSVINAATANVTIFATETINFVDAVNIMNAGVGLTAIGNSILIGNSITTAGAQTFDGAVVLTADAALTSTGGGNIAFNSTVDGAFGLTVNTSGTTQFNGGIGTITHLGALTTDAGGTTAISFSNATSINIDGTTVFGDDVALSGVGQSWNLFGTTTFNGTFGGNVDVIMNPSETLTFNGAVTARGLQIGNGGTVNINGGSIRMTNYGLRIANPVVLGADTVITIDLGTRESRFTDTIDGGFSLTVNSPGIVEFRGAIGGTTALTSLFTNGGGTTVLEGGAITLSGGPVTFNDAVFLNTDTTITGAGAVAFNTTVDSEQSETNALTVSAAGNVSFADTVGAIDALSTLDVTSGGVITVNGAVKTNNGNVSFAADSMAIAAAVNAGTGIVTLDTFSANRQISLGDEVLGRLSLTDAELDLITADTIRIGGISSGDITIASAISPANAANLELTTAGSVTDGTLGEQSDLIATNVTINAGTGIGTAADEIDVAAALLTVTNTTSGAVNVLNTGAVTVTGDSVVSSFAAAGTTFNVDTAATVTASGTIGVVATTANLNGNLTATGGITGSASTINVLGSAGGAEIQDAVDLAADSATVNVAAGSYAGFSADVLNLSVIGAGTDTIVNAASPAIIANMNGQSFSDMLLQGTGAADEVGILLDGTAAPGLTGITITNVDFVNLDDGIRSQGDIGDGVAANVDVAIAGNSAADRAVFENFLDAAIDVGDTDGDAVYTITDVILRDGADSDAFSANGPGFRFGAIGSVRVQRAAISDVVGDGIEFAKQTGATIDVFDSSISAGDDGIDFAELNGGTVTIARNSLLRGARDSVGDGVEFGPVINSATINIVGNTEIRGTDDGIFFGRGANASAITIAGNTTIRGDTGDGIATTRPLVDSTVIIGSASASVDGMVTAFGGNAAITGIGDDGIGIFGVTRGSLTIRDNTLISGFDSGLEFNAFALTDAVISITGNGIQADDHGIHFNDDITGTTALEILNNAIGTSTNRTGRKGFHFGSGKIQDSATVTIGGSNQVFATQEAIYVTDLISSNALSITGGTYDGILGGLFVDNTGSASTGGSTGQVVIGAAAFVGGAGSTVLEVLTDTGNAGVLLDFSGGATFTGGATGMRLTGPGIDIDGDTLGSIAFSGQTGNYITLANGAEFLPGSPTIIDATSVSFDGLDPTVAADAIAIENKIVHYLDEDTLGLINFGSIVVGSQTLGDSIQRAVNFAGSTGIGTVVVPSGTYGGSVEVWVDNLTLVGQGATTIIDVDAVDPFANNNNPFSGFQVAAVSALSGGGDVTGVTIRDFRFEALPDSGIEAGVELGEGTSPVSTAINTTIIDNTFNDLAFGVFSRPSGGTTVIAGNTMTGSRNAIAFQDAVVAGETITITGNNASSSQNAVLFDFSVTNATIQISGNTLTSSKSDAVAFDGTIRDSTVTIGGATLADANDILGRIDGIDIAAIDGGMFTIANNTRIAGTSSDGIQFDGEIEIDANIQITGNTLIEGGENGIAFRGGIIDNATVTLDGNQVFATQRAIRVFGLQSPRTFSIVGGTYNGTGGSLLVDNTGVTGRNGRLVLGSAAFIGGAGSTVLEVLTNTGSAGVILDFSGAATFTGGATGIRLSGPGIDIDGDTLGSIAFSGQTGDYITLANGAEFLPGSPTVIYATGVSFDGKLASAMTSAELFAVEDKMLHFPDDATLGLIDIATLFVVQGESIQTAVNAAGLLSGPQTVTVGGGTFGGSVEVWVDNLTLTGRGTDPITGTIIDTDAVDLNANNGDANNGFQVAAISGLFGGGDVTGVTIQNFAFDTVSSVGINTGIVLGDRIAPTSTAINTTITNNTFNDLAIGLSSELSSGTTAITANTMTAIATAGISFLDVVGSGETITITGNDITSVAQTAVFNSTVTGATIGISGNTLASSGGDALLFNSTITDSVVVVGGATAADANDISGLNDGIDIDAISGGTFTIANNTRIAGTLSDGIEFDNVIGSNATIQITGNNIGSAGTRVGGDGIAFSGGIIDDATITLNGNQVFATQRAIQIFGLQSPSTFSIVGGTYNGTGGSLLVDNTGVTGPDGRLVLGSAAFIGGAGSTVLEVLTAIGNAGVILDFPGAATFTDGATGIRLSGPGVSIVGNTLGAIAFNGQTGNFIELTDGALFDPGDPTVIDATGVSFDGLDPTVAADAIAIENKIVHYLDDDTLGLINFGSIVVGSPTLGDSIQRAVNFAGSSGIGTVVVPSGTYGGSVEVWVDGLTLIGEGATTIIDTDAVDQFANNGDVDNGFDVVALSALSGGGTVTGVTIDGFAFDTVSTSGQNIGVELGDTGAAQIAENTTLQNNTFNDLLDGVLSRNTIGTTTFTGNTMTDIAQRGIAFLDRTIDGETINVTGNAITSTDRSLVFGSLVQKSNVVVQGNTFDSGAEAISFFAGATNSTVLIGGDIAAEANDLFGADRGIFTSTLDGGSFTVANNTRIVGGADAFSVGVFFNGPVRNGASVEILGNSLIEGNFSGIGSIAPFQSSSVTIAGNTQITGRTAYGVSIGGNVIDSNVTIGPATATVDGTPLSFGGNTIDGLLFGINQFGGLQINGTSVVNYTGNTITGGEGGIGLSLILDNAEVNVTDNVSITGQTSDGIFFNPVLPGSGGIDGNAILTIARNAITGGQDGIDFGVITGNAQVNVTDNTSVTGGRDGIAFNSAVATTNANGVRIIGNPLIRGTTGDGIIFAGGVTGTPITIAGNLLIHGNRTGVASTAPIVGSTIALDANGLIQGGLEGVAFDAMAGTEVTVSNTTVTGTVNGYRVNGSVTNDTANRTVFRNATLQGSIGPGLRVTTTAGGAGMETALDGDVAIEGAPAMALSGPNQSLEGDKLGDTSFVAAGRANFIELANGALFEPGRPTVIQGNGATFDGVPPDASPAVISQVENRIIDFDDDPTLGQIFFLPSLPSLPSLLSLLSLPSDVLPELGIRSTNAQTPGDWILRPEYVFEILASNILEQRYGLGRSAAVVDAGNPEGRPVCTACETGSDISLWLDRYLSNLDL